MQVPRELFLRFVLECPRALQIYLHKAIGRLWRVAHFVLSDFLDLPLASLPAPPAPAPSALHAVLSTRLSPLLPLLTASDSEGLETESDGEGNGKSSAMQGLAVWLAGPGLATSVQPAQRGQQLEATEATTSAGRSGLAAADRVSEGGSRPAQTSGPGSFPPAQGPPDLGGTVCPAAGAATTHVPETEAITGNTAVHPARQHAGNAAVGPTGAAAAAAVAEVPAFARLPSVRGRQHADQGPVALGCGGAQQGRGQQVARLGEGWDVMAPEVRYAC